MLFESSPWRPFAERLSKAAAAWLLATTAALVIEGPAFADVTLRISFTETHDRKAPDERLGITRGHEIIATLLGNRVSEQVSARGPGRGKRATAFHTSNSETLGDDSGNVVWHVKSPHQLRRLRVDVDTLLKIDVDIGEDKTGRVDMKFLLQKGHSDMTAHRADTGELAHFTLPTVLSSECTIQ